MKWEKIQGLNYEISNTGLVRNYKRRNIISQRRIGNTKYMTVFLEVNGRQRIFSIHRLVAIYFVSNLENLKEVNHKDGNKLNNHYKNLRWVSRSENMKHMYETGLKTYKPLHYKGKFGKDHNRSKTIKCIETGIVYGSMSEAERKLKLGGGSVSWSIKHKKPIYGMHFEINS